MKYGDSFCSVHSTQPSLVSADARLFHPNIFEGMIERAGYYYPAAT